MGMGAVRVREKTPTRRGHKGSSGASKPHMCHWYLPKPCGGGTIWTSLCGLKKPHVGDRLPNHHSCTQKCFQCVVCVELKKSRGF